MVANVEDLLSINHMYLKTHLEGHLAPWGKQIPHNSHYGAFALSSSRPRKLPLPDSEVTHEWVHPSALAQDIPRGDLKELVDKHPDMIWTLLPFEEEVKMQWQYEPSRIVPEEMEVTKAAQKETKMQASFLQKAKTQAKHYAHKAGDEAERFALEREVTQDDSGRPLSENTWLGRLAHHHTRHEK